MKLKDFVKDRGMLLLLHLVCMCLAAAFLHITGYGGANILLLLTVWLLVLSGWMLATYLQRRKFFQEVEHILDNVDQRYLLGELIPDSYRLEDRLYKDMILRSNKSCIERIRQIEDERREYKEYIESWVHEIKAPIAGIALLCDNRRGEPAASATSSAPPSEHDDARYGQTDAPSPQADYLTVRLENQRIENCVDMVLYYARSEEVYKDYLIRETRLEDVVCEVLVRNRLLLIRHGVQAHTDCPDTVYTDGKWIAFILNQLLLNSVKYRGEHPLLLIRTQRQDNGVLLTFEDNGIGIRPEELARIFEKGFTGSNGRDNQRSTGMGLYLCRKLCDRLGIGLSATSEYGAGTRLCLEFPLSTHIVDVR